MMGVYLKGLLKTKLSLNLHIQFEIGMPESKVGVDALGILLNDADIILNGLFVQKSILINQA